MQSLGFPLLLPPWLVESSRTTTTISGSIFNVVKYFFGKTFGTGFCYCFMFIISFFFFFYTEGTVVLAGSDQGLYFILYLHITCHWMDRFDLLYHYFLCLLYYYFSYNSKNHIGVNWVQVLCKEFLIRNALHSMISAI